MNILRHELIPFKNFFLYVFFQKQKISQNPIYKNLKFGQQVRVEEKAGVVIDSFWWLDAPVFPKVKKKWIFGYPGPGRKLGSGWLPPGPTPTQKAWKVFAPALWHWGLHLQQVLFSFAKLVFSETFA